MEHDEIIETVKDYYGLQLKSTEDLKTNVCSTQKKISKTQLILTENIPEEIKKRYYGCGLDMPDKIEGGRVVDLGCGSGMDCYVLAQLIGNGGSIVGVDVTLEQINIARKYSEDFKRRVKETADMTFVCGYLEKLTECGLKENEFDVAISNCVINLTADKDKVFQNVFNILKDGGELYFSDVYSDQDISQEAKENKVLWGECISGALCWRTLFSICESIGFSRPRLVKAEEIKLSEEIRKSVGEVEFISATYRIFKINMKKSKGNLVRYVGQEPIQFDILNTFQPNEVYSVDKELSSILSQSRYKDFFEIQINGDQKREVEEIFINPFLHCKKNANPCCQSKCC